MRIAFLEVCAGNAQMAHLHLRFRVDSPDIQQRFRCCDGVHEIIIARGYQATLVRGAMFTWAEIEPRLLAIAEEIAAEMTAVRDLIESVDGVE